MTPNTIEFRSTSDNTWVMRITADRKIEVNEDVDVTFAAQKVLDAMQGLLTPQRTWVGLTDEEIDKYFNEEWSGYSSYHDCFKEVMRWQETKLKEKNGF